MVGVRANVTLTVIHTAMCGELYLSVSMLAGCAIPVACFVVNVLSTVGVNVTVTSVANFVLLITRVGNDGRHYLRAAGVLVPMTKIIGAPLC